MRTLSEYMTKANEFDRLANIVRPPEIKGRYADIASVYRIMANERKRLIAEHIVAQEHPEQTVAHA